MAQKEKSERAAADQAKVEAAAKQAKEDAAAKSKEEAAKEIERVNKNDAIKEEIK